MQALLYSQPSSESTPQELVEKNFKLLKDFFTDKPVDALNITHDILEILYKKFGGAIPATYDELNAQQTKNFIWSTVWDSTHVKVLETAKKALERIIQEQKNPLQFTHADVAAGKLTQFKQEKAREGLQVIFDLLHESRSKNWSKEGIIADASLNNQLMTRLLIRAGCNEANISSWLEQYGTALLDQMGGLFISMSAPVGNVLTAVYDPRIDDDDATISNTTTPEPEAKDKHNFGIIVPLYQYNFG